MFSNVYGAFMLCSPLHMRKHAPWLHPTRVNESHTMCRVSETSCCCLHCVTHSTAETLICVTKGQVPGAPRASGVVLPDVVAECLGVFTL